MSSDRSDIFMQTMETFPAGYNMLSLNYLWDIQDGREKYEGSSGELFNRNVDVHPVASCF